VNAAAPVFRLSWDTAATRLAILNVVGGAAVLASYAWGLSYLGDDAAKAWGGVPESLRPLYQISMVLAAVGYFPMTLFVLGSRRGDRPAALTAAPLYAAVLACSAFWLPLTCVMLERPSSALWWIIRIDLAIVGVGSLALLGLIARNRPAPSTLLWKLALAGAVAFSLQTAVLDAIVWPAYFSAGR
jgi:hypothetical protein